MNRWIAPVLVCLATATITYQTVLIATPFALMQAASAKVGKNAPTNRLSFPPMTTARSQTIVRPSPDLSYSICPFDLSNGPVLIRVEPVPGRYWSISVFDARTDVAAVRSDREAGGKPVMLALVTSGQAAPAEWEAVRLGYDKGVVLLRILLERREAFAQVDALRRRSFCRPA